MKNKLLILLLTGLKNKALSGPCTKHNNRIVDCCRFLLDELEGRHE